MSENKKDTIKSHGFLEINSYSIALMMGYSFWIKVGLNLLV